jgi:hypothetical protein
MPIPIPVKFLQVPAFELVSLKHSANPISRKTSPLDQRVPSDCLVGFETAFRPDGKNARPKYPASAFTKAPYRRCWGESILFFEQGQGLSPKNGISRLDMHKPLILRRMRPCHGQKKCCRLSNISCGDFAQLAAITTNSCGRVCGTEWLRRCASRRCPRRRQGPRWCVRL